jgi:hypothetical protein
MFKALTIRALDIIAPIIYAMSSHKLKCLSTVHLKLTNSNNTNNLSVNKEHNGRNDPYPRLFHHPQQIILLPYSRQVRASNPSLKIV